MISQDEFQQSIQQVEDYFGFRVQAYVSIQKELQLYKGTVRIKNKKGRKKPEYYLVFTDAGKRVEIYIKKGEEDKVLACANHKKALKATLRQMNHELHQFAEADQKKIRAWIWIARRLCIPDLVAPHESVIFEELINQYRNKKAASQNVDSPNKRQPSSGSHQVSTKINSKTNKQKPKYSAYGLDGTGYRSHVELNCHSLLTFLGIFPTYEVPIFALDCWNRLHSYKIDFSFYSPYARQNFYYEHMGMLDQEKYHNDQRYKLEDYRNEGIYLKKNLIITTSTDIVDERMMFWKIIYSGAFDPIEVRRKLRRYFKELNEQHERADFTEVTDRYLFLLEPPKP